MTNPFPDPKPGNPIAGLIRRLWTFVGSVEVSCVAPHCGRPQIGLSQYCRRHTDDILGWEREKWRAST